MSGWAVALTVIAAVLLLVVWLLSRTVRIILAYDGELELFIRFLFVRYVIYPEKPEKINLRDYSPKAFAKRGRVKATKRKKPDDAQNGGFSAGDVREIINTVRLIIGDVLKRLSDHVRVDVDALDIVVASGDAAQTGIVYGYVSQSVAYIINLLGSAVELHADNVSVAADFCAEKPSVKVKIIFSLRAFRAFALLIAEFFTYIRNKNSEEANNTNGANENG